MQNAIKSITTTQISQKKGVEKITMLTAYDALMAKIFDGEVDMIFCFFIDANCRLQCKMRCRRASKG